MDDFVADRSQQETSGVTVHQLGPACGAEIRGVDATRPLDEAETAIIRDALTRHGVVLFPNQNITRAEQAAFGAHFGNLSVHPFSPHLAEMPEMIALDNDGDNPPLQTDCWHSDETFRLKPAMGTILRAVIVPPFGGDTLFASMTAAYEGLSDRMQQFISGLEARHDFKNFRKLFRSNPEHRQHLMEMEDRFPNPVHPVVRLHPISGKKAIFVSPQFTVAITGMREDESEALLSLLYQQAHIPEYQYRIRWEPDLMAFWDNPQVQHYAARDYLPHRRRVERVTIEGDIPYGETGPSRIPGRDADRSSPTIEAYGSAGQERDSRSTDE